MLQHQQLLIARNMLFPAAVLPSWVCCVAQGCVVTPPDS